MFRVEGLIPAFLATVVIAGSAKGQSLLDKTICPEGPAGAGCRSFKEAVGDQNENILEAGKRRDHVIVCFRPKREVFLLLSYDSPRENAWHKQENSSNDLEQDGAVEFTLFRNGNAVGGYESLFAVGKWFYSSSGGHRVIRFSGTSLTTGDDGTARIDPEGVHILRSFNETMKRNDPMTHYEFSLQSSTQEFVDSYTGPSASVVARGPTENSGKCLAYK